MYGIIKTRGAHDQPPPNLTPPQPHPTPTPPNLTPPHHT